MNCPKCGKDCKKEVIRMPRLAVKDYQKVICIKKGTLEEYIMLRGSNDDKLADQLGISKAALRYKRENPGKFTGVELAKLNIILQIPKERYL
jgi:hypothetical protein